MIWECRCARIELDLDGAPGPFPRTGAIHAAERLSFHCDTGTHKSHGNRRIGILLQDLIEECNLSIIPAKMSPSSFLSYFLNSQSMLPIPGAM